VGEQARFERFRTQAVGKKKIAILAATNDPGQVSIGTTRDDGADGLRFGKPPRCEVLSITRRERIEIAKILRRHIDSEPVEELRRFGRVHGPEVRIPNLRQIQNCRVKFIIRRNDHDVIRAMKLAVFLERSGRRDRRPLIVQSPGRVGLPNLHAERDRQQTTQDACPASLK